MVGGGACSGVVTAERLKPCKVSASEKFRLKVSLAGGGQGWRRL